MDRRSSGSLIDKSNLRRVPRQLPREIRFLPVDIQGLRKGGREDHSHVWGKRDASALEPSGLQRLQGFCPFYPKFPEARLDEQSRVTFPPRFFKVLRRPLQEASAHRPLRCVRECRKLLRICLEVVQLFMARLEVKTKLVTLFPHG
jgi:hypothetical protein